MGAATTRLRHEIAHELSSPLRGASIVVDLLSEAIENESLTPDLLQEMSGQLSTLLGELNQRLSAFAEADG